MQGAVRYSFSKLEFLNGLKAKWKVFSIYSNQVEWNESVFEMNGSFRTL